MPVSTPSRSAISGSTPRRGGPHRSGNRRATLPSDGDVFLDQGVQPEGTVSTQTNSRAPSRNPIFPGPAAPPTALQMEDWEIAPGRIRRTAAAAGGPDNIAFSRAYLSTTQTVQVTDTIAVRVKTIGPGAAFRFDSVTDAANTRLCTLISGKAQVRMGEEPEFDIGPGGLFVVKPGVEARIQNGLYVDCVLQIVVCQEG